MRKVAIITIAPLLVIAALLGNAWPDPGPASAQVIPFDYDNDYDNLIDVRNLAHLNVIRYDLNGNGRQDNVSDADWAKYTAAYPHAIAGMGCPQTCIGYELRTDLDFDTDGDGSTHTNGAGDSGDAYYNGGAGWTPIGGHQISTPKPFATTLEGNGHTISNLYISLNTASQEGIYVGLFGDIAQNGEIRNVGLVNPYVSNIGTGLGVSHTGTLAGRNDKGAISNSYASGSTVASNWVSALSVSGGLVGYSYGSVHGSHATGTVNSNGIAGGLVGALHGHKGKVSGSYATGTVSSGHMAGGLVGLNLGANVSASYANSAVSASGANKSAGGLIGNSATGAQVNASYATGTVFVSGSNSDAGGLIGYQDRGSIMASYSDSRVSAKGNGNNTGGLVGNVHGEGSTVTDSYWDTLASGQATSPVGVGKTPSQLKEPVGYTGIYANWNLNLDGQPGNDDPWNFGTSSQYPALKYGGLDYRDQLAGTDYDQDNDGLIEISDLAQLNAIRYDLDGNGVVDAGNNAEETDNYNAAFIRATAGMGCRRDAANNPDTPEVAGCIGYELTRNLDFDTDGDGSTHTNGVGDSDDAYYNGGAGWKPIGKFSNTHFRATFDGNDQTLSNLFIKDTDSVRVGFFSSIAASGKIKHLGLMNAHVTGNSQYVGGLAGVSRADISGVYVTGSVSAYAGAQSPAVGGLAGWNVGNVSSSHSAASVTGTGGSHATAGGLVGHLNRGTVSASYATGNVTTSGSRYGQTGGLIGDTFNGTVNASYATGSVTGHGHGYHGTTGGLIGFNRNGTINASYATGSVTAGNKAGGLAGENQGTINASYATGSVTGATNAGGLVGYNNPTANLRNHTYAGTVTASYFKTRTTGDGGETTSRLQSPTGYTGIYATWNLNLDGVNGNDDPWDFGNASQYPVLKYGGLAIYPQRGISVTVQSVNGNVPIVSGPVTARLHVPRATGITWQWQRSANGSTWTDIASATSSVYTPVTADAAGGGKYLRVKASYRAAGQNATVTSGKTAKVVSNANIPENAAKQAPIVGKQLRYYLPDAGETHHATWQWRRCDDATMQTGCKLLTPNNSRNSRYTVYTPVAGADTDVGKYLQTYTYYAANDAAQTWTRAESPVLGPVVAATSP